MFGLPESWLIDREGSHWHAKDARLPSRLGTTLRGTELANFVVTNLGFIELGYHDTRLRVRCRPKLVTPSGFASICYFLFDFPWQPIALSSLGDTWSDRIFVHSKDVLEALTRSIPTPLSADEDRCGRFLSARSSDEASPLSGLARLSLAALATEAFETDTLAALDRAFRGRWSVSHVDLETGRFDFDYMGTGFTLLDPSWAGGAGFKALTSASDPSYMGWVESSRRAALLTGQPAFEVIDAWTETLNGLARLRYHRVTVPLRISGSRSYVFSASVDDSSINLRKTG